MKKITQKKKAEAVKDYLSSQQGLLAVAARHGISVETLRKAVGPSRIRKRGKIKRVAVASAAQTVLFKSSGERRSRKTDTSTENANKRWGKADLSLLVDSITDGLTVGETAKLLGRTKPAVIQRKHLLIAQGEIQDPLRFPVPDGIKRTRKEAPVEVEYAPVNLVAEERPSASVSFDRIDLVDLADLVKKYGLNVTITISGTVTTVNMQV